MPTKQTKEILSELMEGKEQQKALLLISDTGLGKTNAIELFMQQHKNNTYCITVGDSFKLIDVIDAIVEALGMDVNRIYDYRTNKYEVKRKLTLITNKLKELKTDGCKPIIILDEAENLKPSVLKMIKELYDAVIKYTSIVLIGTDQILDIMLNRKSKHRQSVPQLYRRFKAGIRYISPLVKQRDFKMFFDEYIPDNMQLQYALTAMCDNYGELHDYLHPALLKASQMSKVLSLDTFRLIHKISNLKVAN
jgi:DNA transposition AAA+ family ATPase